MKKTADEMLQDIEGLIRVGELVKARRCLRKIQPRKLDARTRIKIADLLRRVGDSLGTIRLLNPLVRGRRGARGEASDSERATYAAALTDIGASREALSILKEVSEKATPVALLYQAYALFTSWDYAIAIPILQKYCEAEKNDLQKTIGLVNLAAACVEERRYEEGTALISKLLVETNRQGLSKYEGNTLEIAAQQEVLAGNWKAAEQYLSKAHLLLQKAGGSDEFYVRKWKCIVDVLRSKNSRTVQALAQLRIDATRRQDWETVRECDKFLALASHDEALLMKVYFGTPFVPYREKLLLDFKQPVKIPDSILWSLGGAESKRGLRFLKGETISGGKLKVGQLKHRVFRALVSDFYRPISVASLFATLYPGETYNPSSSATRVHQAIKEVKKWIAETRLPLIIREIKGEYRLEAKTACAIEVPSPQWWEENKLGLAELRSITLLAPFSAQQAARWLGLPRRTTFMLLQKAVTAKQLNRLGSGRSTRYQFAK